MWAANGMANMAMAIDKISSCWHPVAFCDRSGSAGFYFWHVTISVMTLTLTPMCDHDDIYIKCVLCVMYDGKVMVWGAGEKKFAIGKIKGLCCLCEEGSP